ncbi:xanthine dehydrogenase accessory protein XdhC [Cognaticolwellia beringensis]|uniref:Xanthine dehydrogenase accessory protein XdhC n=1 Tax=Cognaticolwellia beringensis TaxID=1967665 RepID=A0A222GCR2_9GAMM|nr:xanthine dehydrogenase accessory protein XdhC [Cognaticolwellia beringensis]ASP49640.1 xanthine dehydrogenase accessory protein XdhC [Cognaticolwellia beringensis]
MTTNWSSASYKLSKQGQAYVLVTLVGVSGSTPRNSGTKMVISHDDIFDTIGGGHLEHKAIKYAKKMLVSGKSCQHIEHFQLGSNLGQCCGGNTSVLFECFAATGVNIMLFGAGHVGKALVPILAQLPCKITWVDSREAQFPADLSSYENVDKVVSDSPELEVASMPANSYFIVMTHNHQMDFEISQAILKRANFHYLGLIASNTKWRRFQQRYKHRDIDQIQVARMSCPIGLAEVGGKLPMEVAVSVSAEIINVYQAQQVKLAVINEQHEQGNQQSVDENFASKARPKSQQGIHWQELKQLLSTD